MTTSILIIDAGMAGLTTAATPARAGSKVDLYERQTLPGGFISSYVREGSLSPPGRLPKKWSEF